MANLNNLSTAELITELQHILDVNPSREVRTLTAFEIPALIYLLKQQADQVDTLENELQQAEIEIERLERELKELD